LTLHVSVAVPADTIIIMQLRAAALMLSRSGNRRSVVSGDNAVKD